MEILCPEFCPESLPEDGNSGKHYAVSEARQLDASLLAPLIKGLAKSLNTKLETAPADRDREARRYFREALQRWSYKEMPGAIQSAEAAVLLDPENQDHTLRLIEYLCLYPAEVFSGDERRLLEKKVRNPSPETSTVTVEKYRGLAMSGQRGIDLLRLLFQNVNPDTPQEMDAYWNRTLAAHSSLSRFLQQLPYPDQFREPDATEWKPVYDELLEAGVQLRRDRIRRWRDFARRTPELAPRYTTAVSREYAPLRSEIRDRSMACRLADEMVSEWLVEFDRFPPDVQRSIHFPILALMRDVTGSWAVDPYTGSHLMALTKRLAEHRDPYIQLFGKRGVLFTGWSRNTQRNVAERARQFRPIRQEVMTMLSSAEEFQDRQLRSTLYEFLMESLQNVSMIDSPPEYLTELREICQPMLTRHELHGRLIAEWGRESRKLNLESVREGLKFLDDAIELSRSPKCVRLDSADEAFLSNARADLLKLWPQLRSADGALQLGVQPLFELSPAQANPGSHHFSHPIVHEDTVYLIDIQQLQQRPARIDVRLKIIAVSLSGEPAEVLGEIVIQDSSEKHKFGLPGFVSGSCLLNQRLYVATRIGIVEFDLRAKTARNAPVVESLPAQDVESIASMEGQVYAGLKGGYLVVFEPEDRECKVLVSSRRKEKQSPLDDREAFKIQEIVADPARSRLLLNVNQPVESAGFGTTKNLTEIWEYRPGDQTFQSKFEFRTAPAATTDVQNDRLLFLFFRGFVSLDLAADKTYAVAAFDPVGPSIRRDKSLDNKFSYWGPPFLPYMRATQCGDRIGAAQLNAAPGSLATITVTGDDERVVAAEMPRLPEFESRAHWFTIPVDKNRFLLSNHYRLWLATPKTSQSIAKPAGDK